MTSGVLETDGADEAAEAAQVTYGFDEADDDDDIELDVPGAFKPMVFAVSQRRVRDLLADKVNQELDPRPSFQRGYVWDRTKASRLIESVLLNVPLPLVYTAEEDDGKEVVIDGQQRLLTLFGFIEGEFPRDKGKFRLSKLKILTDLNGKSFDQLSEEYKRKIQRYNVQIIKISAESDSNVKFEIFERLNSGSVSLNPQELRNCIYRGNFNALLRELATYPNFRRAIGAESVLDRMKDAELTLRFLAFFEKTYLNYPGGIKSFLNNFMDDRKNLSEDSAKKFRDEFKKSADLSFTVFGNQAFKRFSPGTSRNPNGKWENTVNRALFDIVMWGFTQHSKEAVIRNSDAIRNELIDLMSTDEEFRSSITAATGDKGRVRYRFESWKQRLERLLSHDKGGKRLFDSSLRKDLFEKSPTCAICKQAIHTIDDSEVDHIVPWSHGGITSPENAQLAHRFCNRSKSATT